MASSNTPDKNDDDDFAAMASDGHDDDGDDDDDDDDDDDRHEARRASRSFLGDHCSSGFTMSTWSTSVTNTPSSSSGIKEDDDADDDAEAADAADAAAAPSALFPLVFTSPNIEPNLAKSRLFFSSSSSWLPRLILGEKPFVVMPRSSSSSIRGIPRQQPVLAG